MRVIANPSSSINGMIARPDGDEDFLPDVGWADFLNQIEKYGNFIIGRETYELVEEKYTHSAFDDITGIVKIIVTRDTNYEASRGGGVFYCTHTSRSN